MDPQKTSARSLAFLKKQISAEACRLLANPDFSVSIIRSNETGEWVYAIACDQQPDFWFNAFKSQKAAQNFCNSRGWKVTSGAYTKDPKQA